MFSCSNVGDCFTLYVPAFFEIAFAVIAVASGVAALTPTPKDDTLIAKIYRVIDGLALNVGYAKDGSKAASRRIAAE